ncbi:MAG: GNAT family N-acetyltransferase [Verrucomicrobiales bacterium]|nr:GNAT family N-acetyltransferase [Verrucomicrobiales bacterium]
MDTDDDLTIRLVEEGDVPGVAKLYQDVYGDDYPFKEFYDTEWIKRGVFDANIRWFVAAENSGRLLGSAAVMINVGDADDLVSEIGRLVVHPDARGKDLGSRLTAAAVEVADQFGDFSFGECRTVHVGSQVILGRKGFCPVGIEPLAYDTGEYETTVFVCRLGENARILRRGRPVVIPPVFELASLALSRCEVPVDITVERQPEPYPAYRDRSAYELGEMDGRELIRILRLSRDRFLHPEVFGSFRLEHGILKLKQHDARYLVLRHGEAVLGGLGYTWDEVEKKANIFEFVGADDRARGSLLEWGLAHLEEKFGPRYISIDVNAHATRIQQSLYLLGFAPVVYAPSMVYVMGERFDVIRMVKLRMEPSLRRWKLIEDFRPVCEVGERNVIENSRGHLLDESVRGVSVFSGLTDLQIGEVLVRLHEWTVEEGEVIFEQGSAGQAFYIVLSGAIEIHLEDADGPVTVVEAGGSFGELSLLQQLPRSASALAREQSQLLVLPPEEFDHLVASSPATAAVILKNIATHVCSRLREVSAEIAGGM